MAESTVRQRGPRTGGKQFHDLHEIFSHNSEESLWLLIEGKVYDVTNFNHPGKKKMLLMNAGTDASQAFEDIGHSKKADEWLDKLYIGDFVNPDAVETKQSDEKDKYQKYNQSNGAMDKVLLLVVLFALSLVVYFTVIV